MLAAFLGTGALAGSALADPAADTAATGTTGPQLTAVGPTGASQSTTCADPKLSGLPKRPKFTNATIHYRLSNLTVGSTYLIKAGKAEVGSGGVTQSTVKGSFLLPDQGQVDKKITIAAIVFHESCENGPWKLEKRIKYNAITAPAAATPPAKTPAAPAATPAPVTPTPPVNPVKPVKPLKLPKPINQRLPNTGPPPTRVAWLTPIDGGARLDKKLTAPELGRLEYRSDKASSTNALFGLGIVAVIFAIAIVGGYFAFRHRDEVQFEKAITEQLKHLEEGDPGLEFADDPDKVPLQAPEDPPFAETPEIAETPETVETPVEPAPAPVAANAGANGASNGTPLNLPPEEVAKHRASVEAELQRVLTEAGLDAELEGILVDARNEAERHGLALDSEHILQALCEEIDGSAQLTDRKRAELRMMFENIIAEVSRELTASGDKVATQ
jgi:hypothetical protein